MIFNPSWRCRKITVSICRKMSSSNFASQSLKCASVATQKRLIIGHRCQRGVEGQSLERYGDFHKWGTPNGWFIMKKTIYKWMIWGYPYFRKPLYGCFFQRTKPQSQKKGISQRLPWECWHWRLLPFWGLIILTRWRFGIFSHVHQQACVTSCLQNGSHPNSK